MPATKNLCAQISLDLHQKISEAREQSGLTTAQYVTNLDREKRWRPRPAGQGNAFSLGERLRPAAGHNRAVKGQKSDGMGEADE